jgi:hypothetical protein
MKKNSNICFILGKRLTSYFTLFILTFYITSCSGPRTEEDLAHAVFQTFLDDDHRAFKQLYVNRADIESVINNSTLPDDMKQNAKKLMQHKTMFWKAVSKIGFRAIRFKAFDNGVNWQNAEIVRVESDESSFEYFNFERSLNEKHGIQVKDINITFVSDRDTFVMKLDDCIYTNSRGWCLSEDVRIRRKNFY